MGMAGAGGSGVRTESSEELRGFEKVGVGGGGAGGGSAVGSAAGGWDGSGSQGAKG